MPPKLCCSVQSEHFSKLSHYLLFTSSIFPFSGEQVRILLYRECDWTGRRLLFDSSAVQKVSISNGKSSNSQNGSSNDATQSRSFIGTSNGYGYTYEQSSCESSNIAEMVFGSVAMSFKGTSFKVSKSQTSSKRPPKQLNLLPSPGALVARTNSDYVFTSVSLSNLSED